MLKEVITFIRANARGIQYPHNDAMVVTLKIVDYDVHCVPIENGSLVDVLFYDVFSKMNIFHKWPEKLNAPITGFSREPVPVEETVMLPVIVESAPNNPKCI